MMKQHGGKGINKWVLFGIGTTVGVGGGFALGSIITKKQIIKQAREELKRVEESIFMDGYNAGFGYRQEIDDLLQDVTTEDLLKVVEEKHKKTEEPKEEVKPEEKPEETAENKEPEEIKSEEPKKDLTAADIPVPGNAELSAQRKEIAEIHESIRKKHEEDIVRLWYNGLTNSEISRILQLPESTVRFYTKDRPRLGYANDDDDIDNVDLPIECETGVLELSPDDEEAKELTEKRDRYLDEIERYATHPENAPHYISQQEFDEESHLDKVYVNYYDVDHVLVSNESAGKQMSDPMMDLGVSDGEELFRNCEYREDPDVVHIKNIHMNAVYEVTRNRGESYADLYNGGAYVNGCTIDGQGVRK